MNSKNIYIYGAAAHAWPTDDTTPLDLKPQLQAAWGKRFRRINHFIELTLIGAKSCVDHSKAAVQEDCDIYLASEQGNIADVANMTASLYRESEAPMPLTFLNISNNMAGFYLAQNLKLHSSNLTIAHQTFPFETALDIATFNISCSQKKAPSALVGGVEECAYPLADHRERMGIAENAPLAEGSSWLHIGSGETASPLACCKWVKFFSNKSALIAFLKEQPLKSVTHLATGFNISDSMHQYFTSALAISHRYDCHQTAPFHHTHCAYTIASFVTAKQGEGLLHINRDKQDRYAAVLISML